MNNMTCIHPTFISEVFVDGMIVQATDSFVGEHWHLQAKKFPRCGQKNNILPFNEL